MGWHDIPGWEPAWFAEIEPFPSAVLKHHYPEVPNLGDFTKIGVEHGPIDLLVGGTPCQAFSIAGLRGGMEDARGGLALEFCRLVDRLRPRWVLWENVPGVLSSNGGRDFGSILGALGELGYGFAYRVLDAQNFGVPQRRRRVFVVGHLGDWRPAAAVLFERPSLRGNHPPVREAAEASPSDAGVGTESGSGPTSGELRVRPAVSGSVIEEGSGGSGPVGFRHVARGWFEEDETSDTILSRTGANAELGALVAGPKGFRHVARGQFTESEIADTMKTNGSNPEQTALVVDAPAVVDFRHGTIDSERAPSLQRGGEGISLNSVPGVIAPREVSDTVTSKWAKGSGGPSGAETGNLVLHRKEQDPFILAMAGVKKLAEAFQRQSPPPATGPTAPPVLSHGDVASSLQASAGHHGHSSPRGDGSDNLVLHPTFGVSSNGSDEHYLQKEWHSALTSGGGGKPGQGMTTILTPKEGELGLDGLPVYSIQDTRAIEKAQGGLGVNESGKSYTLDTTGAQGVAHPDELKPQAFRQEGNGEIHVTGDRTAAVTTRGDGVGTSRPLLMETRRAEAYYQDPKGDVRSTDDVAVTLTTQVASPGAHNTPILMDSEAKREFVGASHQHPLGDIVETGDKAVEVLTNGSPAARNANLLLERGPIGFYAEGGNRDGMAKTDSVPPAVVNQHLAVAFSSKDSGGDASVEISPTLRAGGHADSHMNGGAPPAVAFNAATRQGWAPNGTSPGEEVSPTLTRQDIVAAQVGYVVRRLTPRECERLQGFPDDYTLIPWKKGLATDSNRYKAIGNSMATVVMRWLGERIDSVDQLLRERGAY